MSKKIKRMIYIVCTLWFVVFAQIVITKVYVKKHDVTQAFARNQLVVEESSTQVEDICQKGGLLKGSISGKLTQEQKQRIVKSMFGQEGGTCLYEKETDGYYVAYGFTGGIPLRKQVGGMNINMNIAITYDENEDKSIVYFGVPVIRGDF